MTDFLDDDVQAAGDDYRDRREDDLFHTLSRFAGLPIPEDDDHADYGYPIPYPPRPEDLA